MKHADRIEREFLEVFASEFDEFFENVVGNGNDMATAGGGLKDVKHLANARPEKFSLRQTAQCLERIETYEAGFRNSASVISHRRRSGSHSFSNFIQKMLSQRCISSVRENMKPTFPTKFGTKSKFSRKSNLALVASVVQRFQ